MQIKLASPRGFCAGVDRAIEIVKRAIEQFGAPIYVRHEVVHNRAVVAELKARGAIFIEELDAAPEGALVVFSAHGVSRAVRQHAQQKKLKVFDATCPLVTKVHNQVRRFSKERRETILIGHGGHPEVEGTLGQMEAASRIHLVEKIEDIAALKIKDPSKVSFVTQTTLSVDDTLQIIHVLKKHLPEIKGPKRDDICYATQNRQDAVKALAAECDIILVVGSENSSNSNRLRELGERLGVIAYLIDDETEIEPAWFEKTTRVGVTSGASAPEILVERVVKRLNAIQPSTLTNIVTQEESIEFSLPKALR